MGRLANESFNVKSYAHFLGVVCIQFFYISIYQCPLYWEFLMRTDSLQLIIVI